MNKSIILGTGIFLLALSIGLVTGISASSVTSVLVPLLFSLVTAGGIIYVAFGKTKQYEGDPSTSSYIQVEDRSGLIGSHLIIFSFGFLIGLYCGVWSKYHSEALWGGSKELSSTFQNYEYKDVAHLYTFMLLDKEMSKLNISEEDRASIFNGLNSAIVKRSDEKGYVSTRDLENLKQIMADSYINKAKESNMKVSDHQEKIFVPVANFDTYSIPSEYRKYYGPILKGDG